MLTEESLRKTNLGHQNRTKNVQTYQSVMLQCGTPIDLFAQRRFGVVGITVVACRTYHLKFMYQYFQYRYKQIAFKIRIHKI